MVGHREGEEKLHYEVVPSGLHLELNRPYLVGVQVDLSDPSKSGIRFTIQDLSQPEAEVQTAQVAHSVVSGIRPSTDLWLGSRAGSHPWDGWIDRLRIARSANQRELGYPLQNEVADDVVADWHFEDRQQLGLDQSGTGNHAWAKVEAPLPRSREDQVILC